MRSTSHDHDKQMDLWELSTVSFAPNGDGNLACATLTGAFLRGKFT